MVLNHTQQKNLDIFRQQLNEASNQDFEVRKAALQLLKIEGNENGKLSFDFHLASDVLGSMPTAVPLVGVSYSYCQTWKYIPPSRRM